MTMHMQRELEKLKKMILALSAVVEEAVQESVLSLEKRDVPLAEKVIASDEQVDQMEVDLEEECLKILALHQPVAIDLRFIISVLKINNDLERIADLAANIAERTLALATVAHTEFPSISKKWPARSRRCWRRPSMPWSTWTSAWRARP